MKVTCPNCERTQEDGGRRSTCVRCGFQPVPSYAYPTTSVFHPSTEKKKPMDLNALAALVRQKRESRV